MSMLFEMIYAEEAKKVQTCICCEKTGTWRGWDDLCNRSCYYDFCKLLDSYNSRVGGEPDQRLVVYFTKYPVPPHSFNAEKILAYIKDK